MKIILDKLALVLATWFGSGFSPKAPGTFGSLAALPLLWLLSNLDYVSFWEPAIIVSIVTITALWATSRTEHNWQVHDDPRIVADEVAGMTATLIWFPFDLKHTVVGFLIFRILDIWKPGPIGYIDEEVPGAPGTVLDDVLAGAASAVIIYFIFHHQY
ncbi:MAG: phosphatidylglycerophosphatase A [bacterium]